jgi:hypothetical protein
MYICMDFHMITVRLVFESLYRDQECEGDRTNDKLQWKIYSQHNDTYALFCVYFQSKKMTKKKSMEKFGFSNNGFFIVH